MSRAVLGVMLGSLVVGGYVGYSRWYVPRLERLDQIETFRENVDGWEKDVRQREAIESALRGFGSRMLGREADVVQHRLRSLLGDLASPLSGVVVSDRRPKPLTNPAVEARASEFASMRGSLDALEVQATVAGRGSLEDVLGVVAAVQSQPWVHAVRSVSLQAVQSDRSLIELRIDLSTLFAPDLASEEGAGLAETTDVARASAERLVRMSRFTPPPVVVARAPEPMPRPKPAPIRIDPRTQWRVVGVTRASEGPRAVVRHETTGESRTLAPGDEIHGLRFREKLGGRAVFGGGADGDVSVGLSELLSQSKPVLPEPEGGGRNG